MLTRGSRETRPQQGVVKEVVFPNGKQDSKATIEMGTLHGFPQAGPLKSGWSGGSESQELSPGE